jgi:transposase InsO family protein
VALGGVALNVESLLDTGAGCEILVHHDLKPFIKARLKPKILKICRPVPVSGHTNEQTDVIEKLFQASLVIDGRRIRSWFLFCNTGRHDLIVGRKWFERTGVLLDCRGKRLIWPDEQDYDGRRDIIVPRSELVPPAADPAHQRDADLRDQALERDIKAGKVKLLRRGKDEKPKRRTQDSEFKPRRTHDMDQRSNLNKMNRALMGKDEEPTPSPRHPRVPDRNLPKINIAAISAVGFMRHVGKKDSEIFTTSLYELDKVIADKKEPEIQDEPEMQALIDKTLPEQYKPWKDVFSKKASDQLSPHRPYDLKIELTGSPEERLRYSPLYKHSTEELEAAKRYIQDNLNKGFIVPSSSPFAAPILFSRKHDGGLRFCVDYRKLNAITKKNQYPLPLIDETLERLCRAKFFTKLDIRQAFHKMRIHPDSEDLTTFRTRYGSYKYKVVPFGLTNGPAVFQRYINEAFMEFIDDFLTAYLDDLLIYSENELDHEIHVKKVLTRLREAGLQIDIKKCEFHVKRTKYLGFIVGSGGIEVDPEKITVVKNWQEPTTVRGIQSFLGFCNFYRRFIRNYGRVARPLNRLTRKDVPFKFDTACHESFKKLKELLISAPVLIHYRPNRPTRLETDSSDGVVAAVLSQLYEEDSQWHPVAFFSKTMAPAECNYAIHDKEMLAIIRSLQEYRAELEGLQKSERFEILTDHRALEYFMTTKVLNSRQASWAEKLSRFYFVIRYRPGKNNALADALSRRQDVVNYQNEAKKKFRTQTLLLEECLDPQIVREFKEVESTVSVVTLQDNLHIVDKLLQANRTNPELEPYREKARGPDKDWAMQDGLLLYNSRLVVPNDDELKVKLTDEAHKQASTAHPGRLKTTKVLKSRYYWPGMDGYVSRYVRNCHTCRRAHAPKDLPPGLLNPLPVPERPWQHISMDFRTFPKDKHGYDAVFVVVDRLTKRPISIPCHKTIDAREMARLFIIHVYRHKGAPITIVSDRGGQFISDFWGEFCGLLGVKLKLSSAFHPQTDGQTEIVNQYMAQRLRPYVDYYQDDWSEWLPMVDFAAACLPHESIESSPFLIECGYEPRLSIDWNQTKEPQTVKERINRDDARKFVKRMEDIWTLARDSMGEAQGQQKKQADRRRRAIDFDVGDFVWVTTKEWTTGRPSKKLDSQMEGPYKILERVGNAYRLDLPASIKVHPIITANRLRRAAMDPVPGQRPDPPPPVEVSGDIEWEVERILASRLLRRRTLQYRAKWVGYDTDPTWYNAENFKGSPHLLRNFHIANPSAPGPPCNLGYWVTSWEDGEDPKEQDNDNSPA